MLIHESLWVRRDWIYRGASHVIVKKVTYHTNTCELPLRRTQPYKINVCLYILCSFISYGWSHFPQNFNVNSLSSPYIQLGTLAFQWTILNWLINGLGTMACQPALACLPATAIKQPFDLFNPINKWVRFGLSLALHIINSSEPNSNWPNLMHCDAYPSLMHIFHKRCPQSQTFTSSSVIC